MWIPVRWFQEFVRLSAWTVNKTNTFTLLSNKYVLRTIQQLSPGLLQMENPLSRVPLKCIKGASLNAGTAGAGGFLLGLEDSVETGGASYSLEISHSTGFTFLFGFRGIGCHYRCDILPRHGIIALYQMKDGVPLYLHHVSTVVPQEAEIRIVWHACSIRVKLKGHTVLNVIADGPSSGHWGFAALEGPFKIPGLTRSPAAPENYEWICLGDGFSNARWRNRHFLSWPEILWGDDDSCLNACVAAGNSNRVLEVVRDLGAVLAGAKVVVATGSDDLIEGEAFEDFSRRLDRIVSELRQAGVAGIYLCTLPPRNSDLENTRTWSKKIEQSAGGHAVQVLDFHDWILPETDTCMVRGEYPGAAAQQLIARKIAAKLGLHPAANCPATTEPQPPFRGRFNIFARKAERMLGSFTLDFPGLVR
jgi:hypothetical protein